MFVVSIVQKIDLNLFLKGTEDEDTVCNKESGQCKCKPNTDGLRCDVCKAGHYDYPECDQCRCNKDGTVPQICDTETAKCLCKENVLGDRCDLCKQGTFNLEPRNPKGCTQCFCSGLTDQCEPSDLYFELYRDFDLDKWALSYAKTNASQSAIELTIVNTDENDGLKINLDEETISKFFNFKCLNF